MWSHFVWTFNASAHRSPEYISARLKILEYCWRQTGETSDAAKELTQGPRTDLGRFWAKMACNSMLGT